ncbi:ABC transporter ATP-binding protein [Pleomorphomonas sp. PLEO]|uniref:ABC transporter ATP-binding protein n=1 Tax=Pleomorphomonas sp. PLEO TaxID=3239306 RepID=UPI00351F6287
MAGLSISLNGIIKSFGREAVLKSVDLTIEAGELVCLLGPSGCGKSTLLRIIAGLERAQSGSIKLGGESVDATPAGSRDLAMVFQSYALYPHMNVAENIGLSLEMTELSWDQRLPLIGPLMPGSRAVRRSIAERVVRTADIVEIGQLLKRRPAQLSGGQRQRVALARAMAREPGVFLMDEPLSNLDAKLRVSMRDEIIALNKRLGATFLFVTHDQADAIAMSDRIALMFEGKIRQIGTPREIYGAPGHIDVATFIGYPAINLFPVEIDEAGRINGEDGRFPFVVDGPAVGSGQLAVRAEAFEPIPSGVSGGDFALPVRLDRIERMGHESLLRCRVTTTGRAATCRLTEDRLADMQASGLLAGDFSLAAHGRGAHLFGQDGNAVPLQPLMRIECEAAQ